MYKLVPSLVFFLIMLSNGVILGQQSLKSDSTMMLQPGMDTTGLSLLIDSVYIDENDINRPKNAAFYAAALPGLGQIYNKKYWKLPIVFGSFATMGYYINYNNLKYQQYRNAYLEKNSYPESDWEDPLAIELSNDNLQSGIDYYRRNRDLLMILLVGVYFIQILDAHVDAHFMEFDVSDDLSLNLSPGYKAPDLMTAQQLGLKLTLNFN